MQRVICTDGANFHSNRDKLVGSVSKRKDRKINTPAKFGEYPVFVEQHGTFRMFTYNKKIASILAD